MVPLQGFGWLLAYYVPTFLLLASILAALGSACNTPREAQNLAAPAMLIMIVPFLTWFYIVQNPNSLLSLVLSFVPLITPLVMILRLTSGHSVPAWQVVGSMALLVASTGLAIWAASKIFRTGILMYGKAPRLGELLRWLRTH